MSIARTLLLLLAIAAGVATTTACTVDHESDESSVEELIDLAKGEVGAGDVPYRPNICESYNGCWVCDDGICYGYACYCDAYGCADSGGGCY